MKSVLISIQPYWVFLIVAKKMCWNISREKTIEVRKNYPIDKNWDKIAKIYCSKDKKSFSKIPKEYQPLMEQFLGKVIGEFVCNKVDRMAHCGTCNRDVRLNLVDENLYCKVLDSEYLNKCQLSYFDIEKYSSRKDVYGWHISDLVIYDKPRELSEFYRKCEKMACEGCEHLKYQGVNSDEYDYDCEFLGGIIPITRPPQSWCYVEEVGEII